MLKIVENKVAKEELVGMPTLDELAREGARRMLVKALEMEVAQYVDAHADERDADGHRLVVRNGKAKPRKVTCGAGTIEVEAPRVNDKRVDDRGERQRFTSHIVAQDTRAARLVPQDGQRARQAAEGPAAEGEARATRDDVRRVKRAGRQAHRALHRRLRGEVPEGTECLEKDREKLLTHYDFPAEHWQHLRTTNVIESPFATVRLRQRVTKGAGSRAKGLVMAYKLLDMAELRWRRLNGADKLPLVRAGVHFVDGIQQERDDDTNEDRKDDAA